MNQFKYFLALMGIALLAACNSNPSYVAGSSARQFVKTDNPDVMIMQGNTDGLRNYLRSVSEINKKTDGNFTLLHKAVMFDKPEVVELLVQHGANPSAEGMNGMQPVAFVKNKKMLNVLVKHGADIFIKDKNGMSLLYYINDPDIIRELLAKGVDPNDQGVAGMSAADAAKATLKAYDDMDSSLTDNPIIKAMIADINEKIKILESYESMPELLLLAKKGDLTGLKKQSKKESLLKTTNSVGNTALHVAAQFNRINIVQYLAANKKLLNSKNNSGKTPLDIIVASKSESAKYLSCKLNKNCNSVVAFEKKIAQACLSSDDLKKCMPVLKLDIHGVFSPASTEELVLKIRFNNSCKKFNYIKCKQLQNSGPSSSYDQEIAAALENHAPMIEKRFTVSCGVNGKKNNCLAFTKKYPGFKSKNEIDAALIYLGQKCKVKEQGWVYTGSSCKAGFAHGTGRAINNGKSLSYAGKFINGQRIEGKIHFNGQPMYDGLLKNGKPNGKGICFYEGEPEECKYYEGKRVDSLYKQRIAMDKQQKLMDEKLAKIEQAQNAQNAQYKQMQMQMRQAPAAKTKDFGDVLMEEGQRRVVSEIFDSLF